MNSPLCEDGKLQTDKWAKILVRYNWNRIIGSDLGRVKETIAIINETLSCPVHYDPRLREQAWGEWEGLTIDYIRKTFSDELQQQIAKGWNFTAPGGESRKNVHTRVQQALLDAAALYPNEKVLIVCHQGVIKCLLYHLMGRDFMPGEDPLLQHNKLHLVQCCKDSFVVKELNIAD